VPLGRWHSVLLVLLLPVLVPVALLGCLARLLLTFAGRAEGLASSETDQMPAFESLTEPTPPPRRRARRRAADDVRGNVDFEDESRAPRPRPRRPPTPAWPIRVAVVLTSTPPISSLGIGSRIALLWPSRFPGG
jgi:hypothetical protein